MLLPGLVVKKVGMTRMIDTEGRMVPVTLVQVDTQRVTKILTPERDGYHAIQVGYYEKPEFRMNKPDLTRLRKSNIKECFSRTREFRVEKPLEGVELGTQLNVNGLEGVFAVDVQGVTKGRGFQGAIKRWNSARGRMSHGSMYHRRTGSIGSNSWPARVFKNKHMPGHMGDVNITVQNLQIMDIDKEANVIALKGSVPGHFNGYLVISPSIKPPKIRAAQPSAEGEEKAAE